jgi:hypothetical protein
MSGTTLSNPLTGTTFGAPGTPGGGIDNPLLSNPPVAPTAPTFNVPAPLQGDLPGAGGRDPLLPVGPIEPDAPGGIGDPFQPGGPFSLPGSTLLPSLPSAGGVAAGLNWLEELAIRTMLVVVGLVLITGGFKIAASRGILSGTGPLRRLAR